MIIFHVKFVILHRHTFVRFRVQVKNTSTGKLYYERNALYQSLPSATPELKANYTRPKKSYYNETAMSIHVPRPIYQKNASASKFTPRDKIQRPTYPNQIPAAKSALMYIPSTPRRKIHSAKNHKSQRRARARVHRDKLSRHARPRRGGATLRLLQARSAGRVSPRARGTHRNSFRSRSAPCRAARVKVAPRNRGWTWQQQQQQQQLGNSFSSGPAAGPAKSLAINADRVRRARFAFSPEIWLMRVRALFLGSGQRWDRSFFLGWFWILRVAAVVALAVETLLCYYWRVAFYSILKNCTRQDLLALCFSYLSDWIFLFFRIAKVESENRNVDGMYSRTNYFQNSIDQYDLIRLIQEICNWPFTYGKFLMVL